MPHVSNAPIRKNTLIVIGGYLASLYVLSCWMVYVHNYNSRCAVHYYIYTHDALVQYLAGAIRSENLMRPISDPSLQAAGIVLATRGDLKEFYKYFWMQDYSSSSLEDACLTTSAFLPGDGQFSAEVVVNGTRIGSLQLLISLREGKCLVTQMTYIEHGGGYVKT